LCHLSLIAGSLLTGFLLRFDFAIPHAEIQTLRTALPFVLISKMLIFVIAGLHRGWWKLVGVHDIARVFLGNVAASVLVWMGLFVWIAPQFPRSVIIIDFILCFLLTAAARFAVRFYNEVTLSQFRKYPTRNVLIYGAGKAAVTLLQEFHRHPLLGRVVGLIDDNTEKRNMEMGGAKVLGSGRDLVKLVKRFKKRGGIEEIIIAMPSASGRQIRDAVANARATGVRCKIMPSISDLITGKVLSGQIRDVSVEDLLGRDPVELEEEKIRMRLSAKCVLVTGGAGSIGSELCRQVAGYDPALLIIFDQAESDLYRVDMELRQAHPDLSIIPVVGDIRDSARVESVLARHKVDFIFHAAAYKHVPMMETNVSEAVNNNVVGTWILANAARRHHIPNFLMISSDKAVNPTNIMGLTKRIAELIVSALSGKSGNTCFTSVRFGNVLGSNGSVVPLFRQQIAAGGPVTVTHPEIRRFFMTVREAVQLVLQASTMGLGSEIFVLEMGEPVRILHLARNMIRLSGLEPDEDIEIRFIGLRPGEKLFEEVARENEQHVKTCHSKIRVFQGPRPGFGQIETWFHELQMLLVEGEEQAVVSHMSVLVPEYQVQARRGSKGPAFERTTRHLGAAAAG